MSAQYKVRKNQTVRYENATGVVKFLRITGVTSQSAVALHDFKGTATISAVPKGASTTPGIPVGVKPARYAWVNA
jgi:hypothetical protein